MKKIAVASLMLGLSSGVFAYNKVVCSRDGRPADGNLIELSFIKDSENEPGVYKVSRRIVTAGRMGFVDDKTRSFFGTCKSDSSQKRIACENSRISAELGASKDSILFKMSVLMRGHDTESYHFAHSDCVFED